MKWLSRGSVGLGFAKSSKLEKLHGASCDTTLPIEALEAETAMRVARENERCEAGKQVEDRLILTEMAMRLRVSLFAEIFCPSERAPKVSCSGSAIIEGLLSLGFAASSEDAVLLGNRLALVGALIGTDGPAIFIASEGSRYRFAADRYAQLVHGKEREQLVDATRVEGAMGGTSSRMMAELAQNMRHPDLGVPRCASAQRGMTFAGRDAVNWIISNELAYTRHDAVSVGNALVRAGVFFADHRNFVDGETLYFFAEDGFTSAAAAAFRC